LLGLLVYTEEVARMSLWNVTAHLPHYGGIPVVFGKFAKSKCFVHFC
jgi:hypothetical protein